MTPCLTCCGAREVRDTFATVTAGVLVMCPCPTCTRTVPPGELAPAERQLAEAAVRVIEVAADIGLPDPPDKLGVTPLAMGLIARAYVDLRAQVRAIHDLVDQTDPNDPIGVALTKVGLERRPPEPQERAEPHVVRSAAQVQAMSSDDLLALYCRVMREVAEVFIKYETYVVRHWDGMDGCWTDCTGEVGREEALRYWANRTDGGTRCVAYDDIDYYRIFPGGTRMHWDGSEAREMHR